MINLEGTKDFADIFKDLYRDTMSVIVMLITSTIQSRLVEIMYLAFTPHARVRVTVHDSAQVFVVVPRSVSVPLPCTRSST